jgi:hypothetical protein
MRRCSNCQFENVADAKACARCGQELTSSSHGTADMDTTSGLPDWMRSLQQGVGGQTEVGASLALANAVATAATLPVQVRRSRVPVLSVSGPPRSETDAPPLTLPVADATAPHPAAGSATRHSRRWRLIIPIAIIIACLIYLAIHFGA